MRWWNGRKVGWRVRIAEEGRGGCKIELKISYIIDKYHRTAKKKS